jgi:hypothetical protein
VNSDFQPTEIQQELVTLATNVDLIRRFRYQDADHARMASELVPAVEAVTLELVDVLDRIHRHYNSSDDEPDLMSNAGMVADISSMSRQEVVTRLGKLKGEVQGAKPLDTIGLSMGLLGTLRRTSVVVENQLADTAEIRRRLRSQRELDLLLEIRSAGFELALVLGQEEPPSSELRSRLQPTQDVLGGLIDRDLYWELPDDARVTASDLHARVRMWSGGGDGYDSVSGRHLWRALRAYVDRLRRINERHELLEYDRSIVRMAHSTIFGPSARGEQIPTSMFKQLRNIAGRDPVIDRLLATDEHSSANWREPLMRLRESL